VDEVCPATLLFGGCNGVANASRTRGGDVGTRLTLGLVGLRGLRGLRPPARPCGADLFDRTGVTVGGETDLYSEERRRVNYDTAMKSWNTHRGFQTISSCSSSEEDSPSTSLNTSPTGSVVSVLASSSSECRSSAAERDLVFKAAPVPPMFVTS
jgi:hypothetical protein